MTDPAKLARAWLARLLAAPRVRIDVRTGTGKPKAQAKVRAK